MDTGELITLARQVAKTHHLDPKLVCAVVEQESGWEPWAIRYEPRFEAKYEAPLDLSATEEVARSISWGLMQIMGENARERGYKGLLPALCAPATGLEYGCRQLKVEINRAKGNVEQALQFWNGGGNPFYAKEVMARMEKY